MKNIILTLLLLFFVGIQSVSAEIGPTEKSALKALYDCNPSLHKIQSWYDAFDYNGPRIPVGSNKATNRKLHNFSHEKIPAGLTLDLKSIGDVNDGVVKMDLSGKGLTCLPLELEGLMYINVLDLSDNEIQSNTLKMFDTLTTLVSLDLSNNRKGNVCDGSSGISGEIPAFGTPFFIEKLDLSGNCLTGIVVNSRKDVFRAGATDIEYFDISDNMISGGLPDRFDFLNKAKKIDVSCNKFNGILGGNLERIKMTTPNSFIMQRTGCPMKEQGNSFPKKVQKKARNGGNVFVYNAEPLGTANLKKNQFESKVSLPVRNIIARYIQKLSLKLKGKTKAQIIQVKKKELERIKTIAKKYQPLSKTDMNMLKYLFIEIENL